MNSILEAPRKWLLLPIETKNREFHGKMLLSCFAAAAGYSVVLGHKGVIRSKPDQLPTGIVLEKSAEVHICNNIKMFKNYGHKVLGLCEEGLVYHRGDTYVMRRVYKDTLDATNFFFTWGSVSNKDVLMSYPDMTEKIMPTGNPRFDLLKKKLHPIYSNYIQNIHENFGSKLILINTNFEIYVTNQGIDMIAQMEQLGKLNYEGGKEFYLGWREHKKQIFYKFISMLKKLSSCYPDCNIVIRPHPSESHRPYIDLSNKLKNVHVSSDNNVIPWILASKAVIHNNCTTGVEAFLAGRNAISYQPVASDEFDFYLPNALSHCARNSNDTLELVSCSLNNSLKIHDEDKMNIAKQYIYNAGDDYACEKIVQYMDDLNVERCSFDLSKYEKNKSKTFIHGLKRVGNKFLRRTNPNAGYAQQKFSGITLHEVNDILASIRNIKNDFNGIQAFELDTNCFVIMNTH